MSRCNLTGVNPNDFPEELRIWAEKRQIGSRRRRPRVPSVALAKGGRNFPRCQDLREVLCMVLVVFWASMKSSWDAWSKESASGNFDKPVSDTRIIGWSQSLSHIFSAAHTSLLEFATIPTARCAFFFRVCRFAIPPACGPCLTMSVPCCVQSSFVTMFHPFAKMFSKLSSDNSHKSNFPGEFK